MNEMMRLKKKKSIKANLMACKDTTAMDSSASLYLSASFFPPEL